MKVVSVDHITINCRELDKSIAFYTGVLGLKRLNTVDMGDHVLHYLQLPGGTRLELIHYKEAQKVVQAGATDIGVYRHFAVKVDDLDAAFDACEAFGAKVRLKPTHFDNIGCTVILVEDPNGVEVEIIQA